MRKKAVTGNALTEYTLPLAILVGVSGILMTVTDAPRYLSDFLQSSSYGSVNNHTLKVAAFGTVNSSQYKTLMGQIPGTTTITFTTQSGTTITLPGYPSDITKLVETVGVNGTSAIISNFMMNLAQKLLATGDINKSQFNALVAVAKEGQVLSASEQALESAAKTAANGQAFDTSAVTVDGQKMTVDSIAWGYGPFAVGYATNSNDPNSVPGLLTDTQDAIGASLNLINLYSTASQVGALGDPAVQQLVTGLTTGLASLGNIADDSACNATVGMPPADLEAQMQAFVSQSPAAAAASGVCGTDGITCGS